MDQYKELYRKIKSLKTFLKVTIVLYLIYLILSFTPLSKYFPTFILIVLYSITPIVFLLFIWMEMPSKRYDKITYTILIILFGVFAILMWMPTEEEIKNLVDKQLNE